MMRPESWIVAAGRPTEPGSPLNAPLVPASNFLLDTPRAYARDDGTATWEALEAVVGAWKLANRWPSPLEWPPSPPSSIS